MLIGALLAVAFVTFFEWSASRWPDRQWTLSTTIWRLGSNFPLSIFIMGMFAGGLAVHFFWHWCPPGALSGG